MHRHADESMDRDHVARPYDELLRASFCLDCRLHHQVSGWTTTEAATVSPFVARAPAKETAPYCAELDCSSSNLTPGSIYCNDHNGLVPEAAS